MVVAVFRASAEHVFRARIVGLQRSVARSDDLASEFSMVNVDPIINDSDRYAFAASDFVRRLDVRVSINRQPAHRGLLQMPLLGEKCPCVHGGE